MTEETSAVTAGARVHSVTVTLAQLLTKAAACTGEQGTGGGKGKLFPDFNCELGQAKIPAYDGNVRTLRKHSKVVSLNMFRWCCR